MSLNNKKNWCYIYIKNIFCEILKVMLTYTIKILPFDKLEEGLQQNFCQNFDLVMIFILFLILIFNLL